MVGALDRALAQQPAQLPGDRDLARVGPHRLVRRRERDIRAQQRLDRHCRGDACRPEQALGVGGEERAESRHELGPVQDGQPFLGTEPQRLPKGQNLTQRSVEHFYFWGIADELRAARVLPPDYPMNGIIAYESLATDYWYAPPLREIVNAYYFQNNERLPQYQVEMVMRKRMAGLPNVVSRFGWSAETVAQDDAGVRVTIASDGRRETIAADYVVGCDGGHSTVRQQIGIERTGADFDQLMVLALFRSRELNERLKRFPPRSTYRVMHPDLKGYWQFFGRVDVEESWFFHAPVPADTTRDNYDFHGLLQRAAGFNFACDFDYVGFWDLHTAVAEKYQVGRAFIAGDAAHSHPPYGAYGLNNGLDDVANLGWKIDATLKGWGGA